METNMFSSDRSRLALYPSRSTADGDSSTGAALCHVEASVISAAPAGTATCTASDGCGSRSRGQR